jgi:hypothetical protein
LGNMLVADVRYRAADDGSYLLPARRIVKEKSPPDTSIA